MPSTTRVAVMAGALVYPIGLAACNKKDQGTVVDTTASGTQTATVSVDTTPLKVSDIQVGKAVGTDNKGYCRSCYTGIYPVEFPRDERTYLQLALKLDKGEAVVS